MSMMFCRGCGKEIHETAVACPHCGMNQKEIKSESIPYTSYSQVPTNRKNWFIILFLLLFAPVTLYPLFTGDIYYKKGEQVLKYSKTAKTITIILCLMASLGYFAKTVLAVITLYENYTISESITEVIRAIKLPKFALEERLALKPNSGLLTDVEIENIAAKTRKKKVINNYDYNAALLYAEIVATVHIDELEGDGEGHIYTYTTNGGKSWVCGSTDIAIKYFPDSCHDTEGVHRPKEPEVVGLWLKQYADTVYKGCIDRASQNTSTDASVYCNCVTNNMATTITQDDMPSKDKAQDILVLTNKASQQCIQEMPSPGQMNTQNVPDIRRVTVTVDPRSLAATESGDGFTFKSVQGPQYYVNSNSDSRILGDGLITEAGKSGAPICLTFSFQAGEMGDVKSVIRGSCR